MVFHNEASNGKTLIGLYTYIFIIYKKTNFRKKLLPVLITNNSTLSILKRVIETSRKLRIHDLLKYFPLTNAF